MSEMPNLEQMLKLWSKKDLWNRIQERNDRIQKLCTHLAERDKIIVEYKTMYESVMQTCGNDAKETERLNKQLAEKEKEIKKLTLLYFGDENTETILTTNKMIQHIKISFAVEQLEWLKEKVNNAKIHKINMINTHELYEILDNQIKQLKEKRNESKI